MNSSHFSLEFLRRVSRPRRSAKNQIASISEYIEWQSAMLTSEQLEKLRAELPAFDLRLRTMAPARFPYLARQLKLLVSFFGHTFDQVFAADSDASRRETAFAIRYWAKESDIIPDFVPEIGYADDSLIVQTVLQRHQEVFRDYCRFRNISWSKIGVAP
jgi:uncharacterized membrane protein YkvA (DUF1232 family)